MKIYYPLDYLRFLISMNKIMWYYLLIILLFSCQKEEDLKLYSQKLKVFYNTAKVELDSQVTACFVVQLDGGCSGCVGTALRFVKENYDNPKANFIISNTGNKMIKLKLEGENIFTSNQIIKDGQQRAVKCGLIHTFPTIYYLDKGTVVEKIILNAENIDRELAEFKLKITYNIK